MPREHVGDLGQASDAVLRRIVAFLEPPQLLECSRTCWVLFSLCNREEVWKDLTLKRYIANKQARFTFKGSWKRTHLHPVRSLIEEATVSRLLELAHAVRQGASMNGNSDSHFEMELREVFQWRLQSEMLPRFCNYLEQQGLTDSVKKQMLNGAVEEHFTLYDYVVVSSSVACARSSAASTSESHPNCPFALPVFEPIQYLLHHSSAAINCFTSDGTFLKIPQYALFQPAKEHALHNIVGLDLFQFPNAASMGNTRGPHANVNGGSHAENFKRELPTVDRRDKLSAAEFRAEYEVPNKPVVLTGLIDDWPAMRKWTLPFLTSTFGDAPMKVNGRCAEGRRYRMKMSDFLAYCDACNAEKPLYVFDKKILLRGELSLLQDYVIPEHFQEDFFELMKPEDRPDYRWILVGCNGSGTPFHTDPHDSSAWNAVIAGCKRVTFYPPNVIPPGVDEALIHSEYYASDPYMYSYRYRLPQLLADMPSSSNDTSALPLETFVYPGEIVFIPSGWWHEVLNIGHTVAVTQNVCSTVTFPRVAEHMNAHAGRGVRRDFRVALRNAGLHDKAESIRATHPRKRSSSSSRNAESRQTIPSDSSSSESDSDVSTDTYASD